MKIINTIVKIVMFIVTFGGYAYMGVRAGQVSSGYENEVLVILFLFVFIYVAALLHIILHEGGHLLAGLATGYTFVSFRIGSLTWVKGEDKKIHLKKMTIKGTGGQCLMCPPTGPVEECPYVWYHLSGGLMNVGLGLLCLLVYVFFLPENYISSVLVQLFGLLGILLGLNNLIPVKNAGIQNDGYNLLDLSKNMDAKRCINLVLQLNALLTVADTFADLPKDLLEEIKSIDFSRIDITNASIANAYIMKSSIYFAEKDYDKVYEIHKHIIETPGVLEIFKNEAKCECLIYEITHGADKEVIEERYDKKLQQYVKATAMQPSRQRLMYAYYHLYVRDEKKAKEAYEKLEKTLQTYPVKADALLELEAATAIKDNTEAV